jgi:hypothetical protein
MLNPSTADDTIDDNTIKRCIYFAKKFSGRSLSVVNLFAIKSTKPEYLLEVSDPVGKENDKYILEAVEQADKVILAWGNRGTLNNRSENVLNMLQKHKSKLFALKVLKSKEPGHPLYINREAELVRFYEK